MNLFNKSKKITAENYDKLWEVIEEKLEGIYNNNPDSYDLENYDLELSGNEILVEHIAMGYNHSEKAEAILNLLIEEGIIKLKDNK